MSEVKNIITITKWFPSKGTTFSSPFVYETVNHISKYVGGVFVYSLIQYIPTFLRKDAFLKMLGLKDRWHIDILSKNYGKDYAIKNIHVKYIYTIFNSEFEINTLTNKIKDHINKRKITPSLIHAHFTWPSGYIGVKLSREFGVPVVITIHENRDWFLEEYNSNNKKIFWTWKNANALIRVNKKDVPLLEKFNNNVFFVPNGYDPEKIRVLNKTTAKKKLKIPEDYKIIFSLGSLIDRKGFEYLIKAMATIVKHKDNVLCFIGGDGPLKNKLMRLIKNLELENYVKLLGLVPDEEISLWMNAADLFVLPSLSESFGVVQIEAMAVGTPVVATINGGSEEIVISEEYGYLCPPADTECLAEKIVLALEKDWDAEKIRKYASQYTWDNVAKEILKIYNKVV